MQTFITTILNALFVLPYLYIFVFLPGFCLIYQNLKTTLFTKISLSLVLGFSLYSLAIYTVRFFYLPFFVGELGLLILLVLKFRHRSFPLFPKIKLEPKHLIYLLVLILVALLQGSVLIRSGFQSPEGIGFVNLSFHDSMQHLAFIRRLQIFYRDFPNPGYSGVTLTNYHYLIDISLAAITRFKFISLFDVYYRIYPIFISLIFSLSIFAFMLRWTKNAIISLLTVILTVFAGNASFYLHFLRGPEFHWSANSLMMNPILDILQNPASTFVLAQFIAFVELIRLYEIKPRVIKSNLIFILSGAIIAGTIIAFKAWGGTLILVSLFIAGLYQLIRIRDPKLLLMWIPTLIISLFLFLPHYQTQTAAGLVWAPGWTLEKMINDQDRWNYLPELFQSQAFTFQHATLKLVKLYSKWITIYIFGNLWIRSVGLICLLLSLVRIKNIKSSTVIIIVTCFLSLGLPLLFNQGRMAYDIEQYSPYALAFASLYTGYALSRLKHKRLAIGVLLLLIILSFPSNLTSLIPRISGEVTIMPTITMQTYAQVEKVTKATDVILVYPSYRQIATLEFTALTNRNTYFSGRTLAFITGTDFEGRKKQVLTFFGSMNDDARRQLIRQNHVGFIFLDNEDLEKFQPQPDLAIPVFGTPAGTLYRITP